MLKETGTKVSISTVKRVLYRHNLKGLSARKKPLFQIRHKKKSDYGLQLHMGTKIVLFGEMSTGLMKLFGHNDYRYVWRKKGEASKPKNTIPTMMHGLWQHHVVEGLCCRRDWCTSQNRWHHEAEKLCGYIEATSQDISQEVKAWLQMGLPNGQ